tara:strand:- start:688 stop:1020 length:333 start_codon:yes stop_codon:yes gene_type:complete
MHQATQKEEEDIALMIFFVLIPFVFFMIIIVLSMFSFESIEPLHTLLGGNKIEETNIRLENGIAHFRAGILINFKILTIITGIIFTLRGLRVWLVKNKDQDTKKWPIFVL